MFWGNRDLRIGTELHFEEMAEQKLNPTIAQKFHFVSGEGFGLLLTLKQFSNTTVLTAKVGLVQMSQDCQNYWELEKCFRNASPHLRNYIKKTREGAENGNEDDQWYGGMLVCG